MRRALVIKPRQSGPAAATAPESTRPQATVRASPTSDCRRETSASPAVATPMVSAASSTTSSSTARATRRMSGRVRCEVVPSRSTHVP